MKTLGILGSGDLGQQIAYYAINDGHYDSVVFFDDYTEEKEIKGFQVIGKTEDIEKMFLEKKFNELLIGIGYKHLEKRNKLYQKLSKFIPFGKIIHSSSFVDSSAEIEKGCVIYPGCIIETKVKIAANSILNIGCTIAHDSVIGQNCFLSPRVAIAGFVNIGESCILGINSTIIDNINIIQKTQLGGASVVIKSIEKSGLYVGNPLRFIRE